MHKVRLFVLAIRHYKDSEKNPFKILGWDNRHELAYIGLIAANSLPSNSSSCALSYL